MSKTQSRDLRDVEAAILDKIKAEGNIAREEVKKTLTEWLNEEMELRINDAVRKEIKRVFREMGRL